MPRLSSSILALALTMTTLQAAPPEPAKTVGGYRGIWFTLGQFSQYGDKYSGGLGTYTANHVPMAVYAEKVNKTFFVYGGTTSGEARHLLCMVGTFDHATGKVSRPVIVFDKQHVDDPHDNPSINIDHDGYVHVFVSGRNTTRLGRQFRSVKPYDVSAFEQIAETDMTYPQIHVLPDGELFLLFTKYTAGRELYWRTSRDGRTWTAEQKLAGMGGHYQVSNVRDDGTVATAFMYHPGGNVDQRTNLYYAQTADRGRTWTTVDGRKLGTPLTDLAGASRIIDYESAGLNVYIHDLNFDAAGRPVILYTTCRGSNPGPENGPYEWRVTRYEGNAWKTTVITTSDHAYDTGSLYIEGNTWRVIGPTGIGPQKWATGGEINIWTSSDQGNTWTHAREVTAHSATNHSYARRPLKAHDPFYSFWADGDPTKLTPSHLYFTNSAGDSVWQLPYDMDGEQAKPKKLTR